MSGNDPFLETMERLRARARAAGACDPACAPAARLIRGVGLPLSRPCDPRPLLSAGFDVLTWTVNDGPRMRRAARAGLTAVMSDDPARLVRNLGSPGGPLAIGHRGARGLAPENSLPGIELALEAGADGVEIDVRLARCGTPVVLHDRLLDRTCRPVPARLEVGAVTADDLQSGFTCDAGREEAPPALPLSAAFARQRGWASPYTVPRLADLLAFLGLYAAERGRAAGALHLLVELKSDPGGPSAAALVEAVRPLLPAEGLPCRARVLSFDPRVVQEAIERLPHLPAVAVLDRAPGPGWL